MPCCVQKFPWSNPPPLALLITHYFFNVLSFLSGKYKANIFSKIIQEYVIFKKSSLNLSPWVDSSVFLSTQISIPQKLLLVICSEYYILVLQTDYTSHLLLYSCLCHNTWLTEGIKWINSKGLIKLVDTSGRMIKGIMCPWTEERQRTDTVIGRNRTSSIDRPVGGDVDRRRLFRNYYHRNVYHSYHGNFIAGLSLLSDLTPFHYCTPILYLYHYIWSHLYCPTYSGYPNPLYHYICWSCPISIVPGTKCKASLPC